MSRHVVDAELEVFNPDNSGSTPDTTVGNTDLQRVTINERLQDQIDQGTIRIHDNNASYAGSLTIGDRVKFRTQLDGENSLSRRWTGLVTQAIPEETAPSTQVLELRASDFVFGVLDIREVTNVFEDAEISASSSSILQTILSNNASEIDQSKIEDVSTTTSVEWNAKSLLECVRELADRGDALVAQEDKSLVFKPLSALGKQFTLAASDRGLARAPASDDKLVNELRVEGGRDTNVDDEQTTQSSTTTVTDSSRIQQRLTVSKSEVAKVEVYTQTTGSGDNVVVRIHPDDGNGSPIDVTDREQDVVRKSLPSDVLDSDGFTTFLMPSHTLSPKNDPWLLIESDGSSGQDIGTDGSGNPTYKAHYPFKLATIVSDQSSIDSYRRRENAIRAPSAKTNSQTQDKGLAALKHRNEPQRELSFEAESNRAHNLATGEVVNVDEADLNASGDYICTIRRSDYSAEDNLLTTALTLQDVTTI